VLAPLRATSVRFESPSSGFFTASLSLRGMERGPGAFRKPRLR